MYRRKIQTLKKRCRKEHASNNGKTRGKRSEVMRQKKVANDKEIAGERDMKSGGV